MPIEGPVPGWILSIVAAATLFAVMFDLGLAIVPGEFRWVVQRPVLAAEGAVRGAGRRAGAGARRDAGV